ncbi:MAG: (deoxy)nucleoside triphosphate pyrophosphohydrolase [Bacillota bacterium]
MLVTAGVIIENGKYLIAQRPLQGTEGGKWEFPGGKVELGEDPRDGLRRELFEELGVEVDVGPVLEVVSTLRAEQQLILLYFLCRLIKGQPRPLECQAVEWLTPGQINLLEKPESDQRFWEAWRDRNYCYLFNGERS